MDVPFTYDDAESPRVGDNSLTVLISLAHAQKEKEEELAAAEKEVKRIKQELTHISEVQLPELMDELRMPEFKTEDGLKVSVSEIIRASMGRSEEEKNKALDWLEAHGHEKLIKRTVEVPFSRKQQDQALKLRDALINEGHYAVFSRKVEPSTLRSFVIEELRSGNNIPLELFKVQRSRRAKVEQ